VAVLRVAPTLSIFVVASFEVRVGPLLQPLQHVEILLSNSLLERLADHEPADLQPRYVEINSTMNVKTQSVLCRTWPIKCLARLPPLPLLYRHLVAKKLYRHLVAKKPYLENQTAHAVVTAVAGALSELSQSRAHKPKRPATTVGTAARGLLVPAGDLTDASTAFSSVSCPTVKVGEPLTSAGARKRTGSNNSAVKMPLVALIMAHADEDVGAQQLAQSLGLNPAYVRKACSRPNVQVRDGVEQPGVLDLKQLSAREDVLQTHILMQELIVDFFNENTSVFSGATRKTRRLLSSRTELLQRFFALLPQMLRAKAATHPELSRAGHLAKQYTALQANTLAALWAAEQKGFDEVREVEERPRSTP